MAQLYATVAAGTAATLLATVLLLLRLKLHGRRPITALTRQWVATSTHTSGIVLALLIAAAISCFAGIPRNDASPSGNEAILSIDDPPSGKNSASDSDGSDTTQALESLRAYANSVDSNRDPMAAKSSAANSADLPDVETMIAKLLARLEKDPNDVNGWKMLGWSYLNTQRPGEAAKAYETALKLEPGNTEIAKALDQAKSAQVATGEPSPSGSMLNPTRDDAQHVEGLSEAQRSDMIHGMVDKLAARLETSPADENGWLRLMSSRMTLGEKDAAKAALSKALAAFASDADAKTRLTAAARELGIESD
ncbi:tetratricopeptide repeat protein [Hyphomicrobium sp.]|uniref:tetratricopeptide repeat protein n=1 Tax=Hyphomicrobium sp. TaxID=82 RepID=UPI003564C439